jgi:putative redox protein
MQSCTRYLEGKKFASLVNGHRMVTDQPPWEGGEDAGPTPPELLLASLGACAGHYAVEYLRARSLPLTGLCVHVTAEKESHPTRLDAFRVEVHAPAIEGQHQQGLLHAVKACLIHNTLTSAPSIAVKVAGATQEINLRGRTALTVLS